MITASDGTYDWIRVTVTHDGLDLAYQVTGLTVQGSDFIDDPGARDWPDDDIREVVAQWLDVTGGQDEIQLDWV